MVPTVVHIRGTTSRATCGAYLFHLSWAKLEEKINVNVNRTVGRRWKCTKLRKMKGPLALTRKSDRGEPTNTRRVRSVCVHVAYIRWPHSAVNGSSGLLLPRRRTPDASGVSIGRQDGCESKSALNERNRTRRPLSRCGVRSS